MLPYYAKKVITDKLKVCSALLIYLVSVGFYSPSFADNLLDNINLDLATTGRYYFNAEDKGQKKENQFSIGAKILTTFNHTFKKTKFNSQVFANWDNTDESRRYVDIRKANIYLRENNFTFGFGVDTFFWGVSESINVVNVLNQSDIMESFDGKVKLGQTFISINKRFSNGDISFYYLPAFRALTFPNRPSYGLPISAHKLYENNKKTGGFAARSLFYFDQFEFALSYFKGTRRSPLLTQDQKSSGFLTPYYLQTENILFDGVYLSEYFTMKLEVKAGKELNNGFTTANIGIEYPSYFFSDYIEEITLIAEYVFDDRTHTTETHGQNDLFIGAKFDFGDTNQGKIRFLYSYDFDYQGQYAEFNYQYRLNDYFRVKAKVMKVLAATPNDLRLYPLTGEEFIKFSLHYAF